MAVDKKTIRDLEKISLTKFLSSYYGIDNPNISLLTHKDIDAFNIEGLKKVPFDIVNVDDIKRGDVILVTDRYNNVGAYLRPSFEKRQQFENVISNRHEMYVTNLEHNLVTGKIKKKYDKKDIQKTKRSNNGLSRKRLEEEYIADEMDNMITNYLR